MKVVYELDENDIIDIVAEHFKLPSNSLEWVLDENENHDYQVTIRIIKDIKPYKKG